MRDRQNLRGDAGDDSARRELDFGGELHRADLHTLGARGYGMKWHRFCIEISQGAICIAFHSFYLSLYLFFNTKFYVYASRQRGRAGEGCAPAKR